MASRYAGKIKVVTVEKMCFPVDPKTLESTATSCYDAYPLTDPDPVEIIGEAELYRRRELLSPRRK